MLGSSESQVPKLIAVKLFLLNSNACVHNPPTSQTDGRTDGRTDRQLIMAIPRYATLRAVKIGQYLTKLRVEHLGFTFLAHPV